MNKGFWYNYDTQEHDYREAPTTLEEAEHYVSDQPAARGLLRCYVAMGDSILEAMRKVLIRCIGDEP